MLLENARNFRLVPKSPTKQNNLKGKEIKNVKNSQKLQPNELLIY